LFNIFKINISNTLSQEDWKDCQIVLSTTNPAIGATPPTLRGKTVNFHVHRSYARSGFKSKTYDDDSDNCSRASFALMDDAGLGDGGGFNYDHRATSGFAKAEVSGTGEAGSTIFTVSRRCNIDSDNKPHKVMVTAQTFVPQLVHYAVPSESAFVYVQAKTKNTSAYPLLASNKVSIYLDGCFMSKSNIKLTGAGEVFQFFIGVDPSIKLEYLPVRSEEYKKGWVSGVEVKKQHHVTIIHNTKATICRVIITDSLPLSQNEKITVDLIEPTPASLLKLSDAQSTQPTSSEDVFGSLFSIAESSGVSQPDGAQAPWPKDFISLNKFTNNIVWLKTLRPGEKIEVKFSYKFTWPQGSQVEIY